MIQLDVRTTSISVAGLYLALAAARFLSGRAYRKVPGFWAWLLSDLLVGLSLCCIGLRYIVLPERASVVAATVLVVTGNELRYAGVRRFFGLSPVPRASLLPHAIGLALILAFVLLAEPHASQNARFMLLFALLAYIQWRTMWPLLRADAEAMVRETRTLGVIAGLMAAGATAMVIRYAMRPLHGEWMAQENVAAASFYLVGGIFGGAWSLLSFGLTAGWLEQQREEAMEAKRQSDDRFRVLLDESPIPTVVLAPSGWIEHVNRKFLEVTGYSLGDLPGEDRWWAQTCPHPDKRATARNVWHDAVDGAGSREPEGAAPELVLDFPNRPSRTLELHARCVGDRVVLQLVDVSLLKAALRAREEILAIVSHDLKAPLTAILLRVEALLRRQADPLVGQTANAIRQSASSMEQLIRDLLDIASLDAGRLRLDLAPTDLGEVVGAIVEIESPLASRCSTRIASELAPLGEVICDRDRVARVLANLVGNAIKFTTRGTVIIRAEPRDDGALLSVSDTGAGIAPEVLPHVFDRYFTTACGHTGTGLGLYIAKGIVEAHGGRLWATSDPGKGSTFSFTLP
jgi:PAS domain-containing protein